MSHDDFEFEPMLGLPAPLPAGEKLLWQGLPRWESLVVRTYHVRKVAIYFGVLIVWRVAVGIVAQHSLAAIVSSSLFLVALGGVAILVLSVLGFLTAGSTVYSITTRRVLLRHGVAVPLTMNIPLNFIEAADLRTFADGTGEISLRIAPSERIGYLITWPHLRTWRFAHPEPCFKALCDAQQAASFLSMALKIEAQQAGSSVATMAPPRIANPDSQQPVFPTHTAAA